MIHVAVGTDVYGAVRSVDRTPIVTKFAMLQFLPIYPLESYYLCRLGKRAGSHVPFVGGTSKRQIIGILCNRINRLSALVAYVRGLGAAMALFASIVLFIFGVGMLSDRNFQFEKERQIGAVVVGSVLAGGLLLSLPTYLFTFLVPERERRVRLACARVLGIAADPANVKLEVAKAMIVQADEFLSKHVATDLAAVLCRPADVGRRTLDMLLVRTAQIGTGDTSKNHEVDTNRILQAIDLLNRQELDSGDQKSDGGEPSTEC